MPDFYEKRDGKYWADSKKGSGPVAGKNVSAVPADIGGSNVAASNIAAPGVTTSDIAASAVSSGGVTTSQPIVQPLVIVPYSSQMQPLYQYTSDGYGPDAYGAGAYAAPAYGGAYGNPVPRGYDDYYEEEPVVVRRVRVEKEEKKGHNGGGIASTIFGLLLVIFVVVTYFFAIPVVNLNVTETDNALLVVISTIKQLIAGGITLSNMPLFGIGLVVALVFGFLTYLASAFSLIGKYNVAGKVFGVFALIGAILMVVMIFVDKIKVGYGAYVVAALTILTAISALAAKRKQKRR